MHTVRRKFFRAGLVALIIFSLVLSTSITDTSFAASKASIKIIQNMNTDADLRKFIYVGETMDWDVNINGNLAGGTANQGVTWKSSNTSVVTVVDYGVKTGHKKGDVTITATYKDGATSKAPLHIKQPATSVSLSKTTAAVDVGAGISLTATINPGTTDDKANGVKWKSSDTSVATVDSKGAVTGKKQGKATITATFTNASRFGSSPVKATVAGTCAVTVSNVVPLSITLDKKTLSVEKDGVVTLKATVNPSNSTNKSVTWTSSNNSIATVNSSGTITAKAAGTATITVTATDGKKSAACALTVTPKRAKSVSLNKTTLKLFEGYSGRLTATVSPSDAGNKAVSWTSSDEDIATVDSSGNVTGISAGKATITVRTADGGYTAKCTVNVTEATVTLDKSSLMLIKDESCTLEATVDPAVSGKIPEWSSDDENVVTVDENGYVSAVGTGRATVTAKIDVDDDSCEITVILPASKATLPVAAAVEAGKTYKLNPMLTPSDAIGHKTSYSTANADHAQVDDAGTVKAGAEEKNVYVGFRAAYPKPTISAAIEDVTAKTLISVYKPVKLSGITNKADVTKYIAALIPSSSVSPELMNEKEALASKGTALNLIGTSGEFYYTSLESDTNRKGFIKKSDIDIVASAIKLDRSSGVLYNSGDAKSIQLTATVLPQQNGKPVTRSPVKWTTSNSKIATVSSSGKVTGISGGKATITAKVDARTATFAVTVIVPTTKIALQSKAVTLPVSSAHTLKPAHTPVTASGHSYTYASTNADSISIGTGTGKITTKSKEGIGYASLTIKHPEPTVGTQAKSIYTKTFISVYKPMSLTVQTKKINVNRYIGAVEPTADNNAELMADTKKIEKKDTLLTVTGSCGDFYYVRHTNNTSVTGFVKKSDVQEVIVQHKTLITGQTYTPQGPSKKALLTDSKVTSVKKTGSSVAINTKKDKKKKTVNTGTVTAKKEGLTVISAVRTDKKKTVVYQIHITVITEQSDANGLITRDTKAYICAGDLCHSANITANTAVTVLSKSGSYVKVKYKVSGKDVERFVPASDVSYFTVSSVSIKEGGSTDRIAGYKNVTGKEQQIRTTGTPNNKATAKKHNGAKDKNNKDIVNSRTSKGRITVSSNTKKKDKKTTGYTKMTVTAGNLVKDGFSGRFAAFVPVTVYKNMADAKGNVKRKTTLYAGGSKKSDKLAVLPKGAKVSVLGGKGNFFYVSTAKGQTGYVLKKDVTYIEIDRSYQSVNKYKKSDYPVIRVTVYNGKTVKKPIANKIVSFGVSTKGDASGRKVFTYTVIPAGSEGTSKAVFKAGDLSVSCYISAYTATGNIEGFLNKAADLHKIANGSDKYPVSSGSSNKAVTIIGKCGDWFRIKYSENEKMYWADKNRVTYISLSEYSTSMYRYNTKDITAGLINSKDDGGITAKSSNTKYATVKATDKKDGSKKIAIWAEKPTSDGVNITASYTYAKGKAIHRSCRVIIHKVGLTGVPADTVSKQVGSSYSLNAGVSHVSGETLIFKSSNTKVAAISKSGKISAKSVGTAKITVSFRALSESFTFRVTAKPAVPSAATSSAAPTQIDKRDGGPYPSPADSKGIKKFLERWQAKFIDLFFDWDENQGVWRSTISSPQYIGGYNGFYDWIFETGEVLTYSLKEIAVVAVQYKTPLRLLKAILNGEFKKKLNSGDNYTSHNKFIATFDFETYDGKKKRWLVEGWKGNYANLGAGGEIGTYYAKIPEKGKDVKHYFTVSKGKDKKSGDMQIIGFELHHDKDDPTLLFGLGPERHWWLSGFRRDVRNADKNDLRMEGVITFNDPKMAIAFQSNVEIIKDHGTGSKNNAVKFDPQKDITVEGATVMIKNWRYTE